MKKLIYKAPMPEKVKETMKYPFDESLWVVEPAPKDRLELIFGNMTQEQYEEHVLTRTVRMPGAFGERFIDDADLPSTREFRNAWCDVTPESRIDIDLERAKTIKLDQMRKERQKKFEELGFPTRLNPELEAAIISQETRDKLKDLRDATEPLKALEATGYNDETILNQIRNLAILP